LEKKLSLSDAESGVNASWRRDDPAPVKPLDVGNQFSRVLAGLQALSAAIHNLWYWRARASGSIVVKTHYLCY
jgi:hypothetical protein